MLFSSPTFLFAFLPLLLGLHALCPRALRNVLLFLASMLFYAWGEPRISLVMLASIGLNWGLGLALERARTQAARRGCVLLATLVNLGLIGVFKYANFLWHQLGLLWAALGGQAASWPRLDPIPLPIGISFFTFQAFSYVLDVYRRQANVQKNPLDFGLYIALFPQLIAGPIVRYKDVAAQIVRRQVTLEGFSHGVQRFVVGLGKKMLIANVVAEQADRIFALDPAHLTGPVAWLGTLCYTLQIYFDFSGYSDMAIGLGLMFGFRFLENFDYPYIARTITDFWRRWHVSLSTWFRDYLYIPLGGNRRGRARTYLNLVLVFFLCGLWHGAAWNFVIWGLYHGAFLVFERAAWGDSRGSRLGVLGHVYTLLVVMVGWVFFRAENLGAALEHLRAMAGLGRGDGRIAPASLFVDPLVWTAIGAGVLGSMPWLRSLGRWRERRAAGALAASLEWGELLALAVLFVLSCSMLSAGTYNPFIYFRF
jgi:alginate O-acetyltransferase complex protein AlgI